MTRPEYSVVPSWSFRSWRETGENHTELRKSAELLMESVIFNAPLSWSTRLISHARQKDSRWDSRWPFWAGNVALARDEYSHGIENWETLRGRVHWKAGSRERRCARSTPHPISDYSVIFAILSGILRRRESAISFSEISRDFFIRKSLPLFTQRMLFFQENIFYFCSIKILIMCERNYDG